MNVVKVNPFFPVKTFSNVLDDLLHRGLNDVVGFDNNATLPSVNVKETDENYVLELAAPGLEKSDFNIRMENDQLIISAEEKQEEEKVEGKWTRKEFYFGKFSRTFTLPETANKDKVEAQYINGVLHLTIAKKEEAKVQPAKMIEIK